MRSSWDKVQTFQETWVKFWIPPSLGGSSAITISVWSETQFVPQLNSRNSFLLLWYRSQGNVTNCNYQPSSLPVHPTFNPWVLSFTVISSKIPNYWIWILKCWIIFISRWAASDRKIITMTNGMIHWQQLSRAPPLPLPSSDITSYHRTVTGLLTINIEFRHAANCLHLGWKIMAEDQDYLLSIFSNNWLQINWQLTQ